MSIDVPNAVSTAVTGINARGEIVGRYLNIPSSIDQHGFRLRDGRFTTIEVPGATGGTGVNGINNLGEVVGDYAIIGEYVGSEMIISHAFVLVLDGSYKTIDYPGAILTSATGINSAGDIVGTYIDREWHQHGFLYRRKHFTKIDFPASVETVARSINDAGEIAGFYFADEYHGFVLSDGVFRTIDVPVSGGVMEAVTGINNSGALVGGDYQNHGFLLKKGSFAYIDFPDAIATGANAINSAGAIVGNYVDRSAKDHGFLAIKE